MGDFFAASAASAGLTLLAVFLPPVAVAFASGLGPQIGVSMLLMFTGLFAIPHALWVVYKAQRKRTEPVEKVYDAMEERRARGARVPPETLPCEKARL